MVRNLISQRPLAAAWVIAIGLIACSVTTVGAQSADPAAAAPAVLRKLQLPPGQAGSVATRLGLQYRDQEDVQISFDPRENQLLVMAPRAMHPQIDQQVDAILDADRRATGTTSGSSEFTYLLRHADWQRFEREFQKLSLAPASVTRSRSGQLAAFRLTSAPLMGSIVEVNRRTGSVHVSSAPSKIEAWRKLIAALDIPDERGDRVTRLLRLKNAEPAPIQRAIRLLSKLTERQDWKGQNRKENTRASTATNSPFRTAAFQQDDDQADMKSPADAKTDSDKTKTGGAGVIGDTDIEFVPELGTIIIKGAKRDVQRVMDVIKEIEEQSELTKPEVEVVQLQHADANAVATLLTQLYEDVLSARQGAVSITSLDAPNALLLIGRTEAIKSLLELIQKIDQPIPESDRMRIFRLQHASATDAEQVIRDFFADRPGSGDDLRPGLGSRVRVLGDYRTNSLIVSASPRDMTEISRLIDDLDVQTITSQNQIKVFPLNNALAEDLAPVIQDAISGDGPSDGPSDGQGDGTRTTTPSTALSIVALDSTGNRVLDSGVLTGATVTADASANAVVVRASAASMPLIGELIRQLDQAPNIDSLVKVFTVENGDALQLMGALQDLFGQDASTAGTSIGAGNRSGLPPSTGATDSSLVPLRFSFDQRTNAIIASGSAEDLEVVESILIRLDSAGFAERITEVIWLRHQGATEIATAIQAYVQQRTQSVNAIQQFQQGLGPFDLPDRDLIVVAEPVTNSLLLSVAPRMYEDVRRLIDRLDRRQPMVMIKVVLAEVSLGDTFEIGGEVGLQDSLVYDRGIASAAITPSNPGFNFNNAGVPNANQFARGTLAATGVSSLGVGSSAAGVNYGGFVLSAASDSVSLLLRTLQTANRMQILSRPQIMTLDNTDGFIQVGRQIARVTDIVNNGISGTQVVTEDIEVGLILRIRPRVGADGLIVMNVDATRSQRDPTQGTQVPVSGDLGAITIDDIIRTTAQSVVAAYSGQTVVFGGLIQKERNNISRRVPFVADIPLIGNFFKFDRETETRNELLVILTPMLVTGEEDLEYVKQTESSRMSWCLADVVEMHGDVGLSGGYGLWGPAVGQTIYPDMQPTIDDIIISDDLSVQSYPVGGDHTAAPFQNVPSETVVPDFSPSAQPAVGTPVTPPAYAVPPTPTFPGEVQLPISKGTIRPARWKSSVLETTKLSSPPPLPAKTTSTKSQAVSQPVSQSASLPSLPASKSSTPATQVSWLDLVNASDDSVVATPSKLDSSK